MRATRFLVQADTLYKSSYTHPLLRCLSMEEGAHVLQEIHSGCCGAHTGTWTLANKALRAGYFWPTMKQDAKHLVSKCERDEEYRNGVRDCASNKDSQHWLTYNLMDKLRSLIASWTTPRGSTGESPFSLVYGAEAVIPAEIGMPSHRVINFSEECNRDLLKENLDLIEELREKAFFRMQQYKNTMINSYNKQVKARSFQVGDLVLRRTDTLKPVGKLDPTWEGPYKITGIIGRGAYELEDLDGRPLPKPRNIHNLKKYYA
ncbi:UNVERIFIED_CONTAM: hypothetical protein Slati_3915400 [Sesamum latifolium]|uniref:Integrase zinc-binding domain-containing protein n=1 Tax=Sesamum latifolium TaxID=2727402 RepID=A0AAW2TM00_9LAMI